MYYQNKNTVVNQPFRIKWSTVGTGTNAGVTMLKTDFTYEQICEYPTSNIVNSSPEPPDNH